MTEDPTAMSPIHIKAKNKSSSTFVAMAMARMDSPRMAAIAMIFTRTLVEYLSAIAPRIGDVSSMSCPVICLVSKTSESVMDYVLI